MGTACEKTNEQCNKSTAKRKIAIIATIVVCLAALIVGIVIVSSNTGYSKVVDKTFQIYKSPTVENIKSTYPPQTWDYLVAQVYPSVDPEIKSADDIINKYLLPDAQRVTEKINTDYGEKWSFSYDITMAEKLSDEVCAQIGADLSRAAVGDMKVEKAYEVSLSYTITGTKTKQDSSELVAVCIDSEWYVAEELEDGWRITLFGF